MVYKALERNFNKQPIWCLLWGGIIQDKITAEKESQLQEFIEATDRPFLDSETSLKRHIVIRLHKLTPEEKAWFKEKREFKSEKRKRKEVSFLYAIPDLVASEACSGFLTCMYKEPGLSISQIATKMGVYTKDIQRFRKLLESLKLVTVEYTGFTQDRTKCFLNNQSKDRKPCFNNIIDVILKMAEEKHGRDRLEKIISRNVNKNAALMKKFRKKHGST